MVWHLVKEGTVMSLIKVSWEDLPSLSNNGQTVA